MKIIVHGASGRMGRNVIALIENSPVHTLAAAISPSMKTCPEKKQYSRLEDFHGMADMIIDFSNHSAIPYLLAFAKIRCIPVVIGTTGCTEDETALISQAAAHIPIFFSGNMSVGIALLTDLAKQTAKAFPGANIEIVESHHNKKLDVPSGTALMLADAIKEVRPEATYNVGRHENGKRSDDEIGIHSIRLGNTIGIHEILISSGTQTITLKHEAHDRMLFAEGALAAAEFLAGQGYGLYDMQSMLQ